MLLELQGRSLTRSLSIHWCAFSEASLIWMIERRWICRSIVRRDIYNSTLNDNNFVIGLVLNLEWRDLLQLLVVFIFVLIIWKNCPIYVYIFVLVSNQAIVALLWLFLDRGWDVGLPDIFLHLHESLRSDRHLEVFFFWTWARVDAVAWVRVFRRKMHFHGVLRDLRVNYGVRNICLDCLHLCAGLCKLRHFVPSF